MGDFLEKNDIIKTWKISSVSCNEEFIEISFYDTEVTLLLDPEGDCCSCNWFEDFDDTNKLIDTYINKLDEDPFYTNEEDPLDNCDETRIVYINDFTFKFRHTCNGYYSGWVNYNLKHCDEIKF
jgi:hypothetical protein